jgi:hypothetical protein
MLVYSRPMFRTVRALTVNLALLTFIMLAIVAVGSWQAQQSPWAFWQVYLYILCVPLAGGSKILSVLWESEKRVSRPDPVMEFLFSLGLLWPVLAGVIPVGIMMRLATQ